MKYIFPCDFTLDEYENDGGFVVTFPDMPRGATGAKTFKESLILAEDALVVALSIYIDRNEELPTPSPWVEGQELVGVQPLIAAQLDLYTAMRERNITIEDLARRLGISKKAAGKLLLLDYNTRLGEVNRALAAVGCPAAAEQAA